MIVTQETELKDVATILLDQAAEAEGKGDSEKAKRLFADAIEAEEAFEAYKDRDEDAQHAVASLSWDDSLPTITGLEEDLIE